MKRRIIAGCTGLFLLAFLTACSVPLQQLKPGCTPQDLSGAVASGKYVKKVDNFHIILDISGSMSQKVSSAQKLATAKLVTDLMNRTIPDGMFTGGMRTLGLGGLLSMNTDLVYGPVKHSQADLAAVINGITRAQSNTPLALAIEGAQEDLKQTSGSIALIIISDWLADDAG
ncbi:MAG: VWA domain-containing protein, partial [Deltaproteobacteria bacterium]|nr:VWA domain-containing protein [Deltaproteobacteria bacterium]